MTKVYSLNGEDYFDDFQDIITDEVEVGGTYWEADKQHYTPAYFFHFGGLLEDMCEQAFQCAGDFAEDFGKFRSERDRGACEAEIRAVFDKYLTCNFWTAKKPIKCEFLAEDLERICGSCSGSGEGMYEGARCSSCGGKGVTL